MKIAVLWSHPSGYLNASLRALNFRGAEIFLSAYMPESAAPFDLKIFEWIPLEKQLWSKNSAVNFDELNRRLVEFQPDIILCSGWANKSYLKISKAFKGKATCVICFDTPWRGTFRQLIGRLWAALRIKPVFEMAFVPGERQIQTAKKLGFNTSEIITGLLAPDDNQFYFDSDVDKKNHFLYVGRLSPEKGIAVLVTAYKMYRSMVDSAQAWPLKIVGGGRLRSICENIDGIDLYGFMQPDELASEYRLAGCMVVPSLYEAWGLQISEAAISGLPIIATDVCGSAVHLVKQGFNGEVVEAGSAESLALAMLRMSNCKNLKMMSKNSALLGLQFSPRIFANNLTNAYEISMKSRCKLET